MNVGRLLNETGWDSDLLRDHIRPIEPWNLTLRAASPVVLRMWGSGIQAMTIKNWIVVDPVYLTGDRDRLARLTVHELVHARQWHEFGLVGFLRRYLTDYVQGRRQGMSHRDAYMQIGFEVEAREVQAFLK
jgi:hypothetical protein